MDIAAWLRELGLKRYEQAFRDNDIAPAVLPELTDQDLQDLGVSLGHRRLLLKAIRALVDDGAERRRADAAPPPAGRPAPHSGAERRQLTVLFADLVGSTELAARLDPEDMGQVIRAYQDCCAEVVGRWGGHIAKYMGDGVLAYFGWPQAHEDEAERAVRAGLELTAAVARVSAGDGTPLAARVGIATGLVMVGELIGEGAAKEQTVVGETPNLAARLQALAAPGRVVISQTTRRLVGGLFALADLGPRRLKGFAAALAAWRVEGEGRAEGRFEALHGEHLTPLVGREHELALLLERWERAKDGDGQVVLLTGEPGIGKSRLLRALRDQLTAERHVALSHFCSPYHVNSALHPITAQLERAAGFVAEDSPEAKLAKLEALIGQATDRLGDVVPLLAALLGVEPGARYAALNLSPQLQKQRTLEVLLEQLAGLARDRPVLELYEDVHWIDPSTLELIDMLVERVRTLPVLVVLTFRPEFTPPWTGHSHVAALPLNRLGRRQGAGIVARIAGDKALPAEVLEQIVARTDGVPLFVEELTKTVLESGLLADAGDHYELSGPLPPLAIPATLHDSLMARLDRLAPVKEVAQTAAVIGREFSHELLAAVSPLSEANLTAALDRLVASELVFRRGAPPTDKYSFKHSLVQDAAYQSLLKSKRQQLHARIAQVLKERFPQTEETEPGLLAHHCTEGGLRAQAVTYWQRASQQAAERSAYAEALAQADKGLAVLEGQPTPDRDRAELKLQLVRAGALRGIEGPSFPEVGTAFARARQLCTALGDTPNLIPILIGMGAFHHNRGELHRAEEIGAECLRLARHRHSDGLESLADRLVGSTLLDRGKLIAAREHFEQALDRYDPERLRPVMARFGLFDPRALGLAQLAHTLCILGYPDQALAASRGAIKHAHALGDALNLTAVMFAGGITLLLRRDYDAAYRHAERMLALADEHGLRAYADIAREHRGMALVGLGVLDEGVTALRKANTTRRVGYRLTFSLGMFARALLAAGMLDEAEATLSEALAVCERTGDAHFTSELWRLKSELLLRRGGGDPRAAEDLLTKAIKLAREQSAKMWELRAATSLARLWTEQGRRIEARDLLAPVYGWFTEGLDTADLRDAKALLDALS